MKRLCARAFGTLLLALVAMGAAALPVQVFGPAGLAANDAVDWAQLPDDGSALPSPLDVVTGLGRVVTATDGTGFNRLTEGSSWIGNFAIGDAVLWTSVDGSDALTSASLLLSFAQPVYGLGAQIQANYYGAFSATLELFDGAVPLGLFVISGLSTVDGDGSAPYLGAVDSLPSITAARFTLTTPAQDCSDLLLNCGFALGRVDLRGVGEPPTLAMVLAAALAVAALRAGAPSRTSVQPRKPRLTG